MSMLMPLSSVLAPSEKLQLAPPLPMPVAVTVDELLGQDG